MKDTIYLVVIGLLVLLSINEVVSDFDILDKDKTVFCEEIVLDTIFRTRVVREEDVRFVEVSRIDTVLKELFYLDTIYSTEISFIRDTMMQDADLEFIVDTINYHHAELRYAILGNVVGFYPSLSVNCPKVKLKRWSILGGYETRGNILGGVNFRVNQSYSLQAIGGVGREPFGGFLFGVHL
jgi:hypothetical protein